MWRGIAGVRRRWRLCWLFWTLGCPLTGREDGGGEVEYERSTVGCCRAVNDASSSRLNFSFRRPCRSLFEILV